MSVWAPGLVSNLGETQAVYQTIFENASYQEFSPFALKPATQELEAMSFGLEELKPAAATFRNGDRYIAFELHGDELSVRIGIGSNHWEEASFNSIRLDTLVNFTYGRLPRGCHSVSECSLQECVGKAMRDLKEFTYEFLRGDFRPFLRTLAMYNREKKEAAKAAQDLSSKIYLA